jgi:hypothetical protein
METRSSFHDDEELHTTPQSSSTRGAARILDMLLAQFHTEVGIGVGVETRKSRLLLACGFTLPSFVSVDLRLLRFTRRLLSVLDYVDTPCPILRASSSTPTYGLNHQERGNRQCPCGSLLIKVLQIAVRCCDEAETWLLRDIEVDFLVLSEVKCVSSRLSALRHIDAKGALPLLLFAQYNDPDYDVLAQDAATTRRDMHARECANGWSSEKEDGGWR